MSATTITQMADRVSSLIEERLGVRGRTLEERVRRAGRRLPRRVREAAEILAEASERALNPKLQVRVDEGRVADAYDICLRHLGRLNRSERRKAALVGMLASAAFAVLVVAVLAIAVIYWRGLI